MFQRQRAAETGQRQERVVARVCAGGQRDETRERLAVSGERAVEIAGRQQRVADLARRLGGPARPIGVAGEARRSGLGEGERVAVRASADLCVAALGQRAAKPVERSPIMDAPLRVGRVAIGQRLVDRHRVGEGLSRAGEVAERDSACRRSRSGRSRRRSAIRDCRDRRPRARPRSLRPRRRPSARQRRSRLGGKRFAEPLLAQRVVALQQGVVWVFGGEAWRRSRSPRRIRPPRRRSPSVAAARRRRCDGRPRGRGASPRRWARRRRAPAPSSARRERASSAASRSPRARFNAPRSWRIERLVGAQLRVGLAARDRRRRSTRPRAFVAASAPSKSPWRC